MKKANKALHQTLVPRVDEFKRYVTKEVNV